jgi:hypothetical protein
MNTTFGHSELDSSMYRIQLCMRREWSNGWSYFRGGRTMARESEYCCQYWRLACGCFRWRPIKRGVMRVGRWKIIIIGAMIEDAVGSRDNEVCASGISRGNVIKSMIHGSCFGWNMETLLFDHSKMECHNSTDQFSVRAFALVLRREGHRKGEHALI